MSQPASSPVVLITPEPFLGVPGPWVARLEAAGFTVREPPDAASTLGQMDDAATIRLMEGVSAVLSGGDRFTPAVLRALPDLRVIARAGVGYDRVDVPAATEQGILLTITPTANHESVAEATMALIFACAKQIVTKDARTRAGQWPSSPTQPIRGKTLGILGLGRIGRSTAVRARAMGMTVLATESYPDEAFARTNQVELVSFDTLLAQSDYLTLHCPLSEATHHIVDGSVLARMKQGSVLINTARGGLVSEPDLVEALRIGHLGGAGLDVFEVEPARGNNPLFQFENVVVSPHVGGVDSLSLHDMAMEAAGCIVRLSRGEWPEGAVVNHELRSHWKW